MARSTAPAPAGSAGHVEGNSPSAPSTVPADPLDRARFIETIKARLLDPTTGDAAFAALARVLADTEGFAVQQAKAGLPLPLTREARLARTRALLSSLPPDELDELRSWLEAAAPLDQDVLH